MNTKNFRKSVYVKKDFQREAKNAAQRCETIAGDGSLCRGTRCMLVNRHKGPHHFGNCEYERELLRAAGRSRVKNGLEIFDHDNMPAELKRQIGQPDPV